MDLRVARVVAAIEAPERELWESTKKGALPGALVGLVLGTLECWKERSSDYSYLLKKEIVFIVAYTVIAIGFVWVASRIKLCIQERRLPRLD